MKSKITKAVITAAGYGTRFLPATKNVPKELLPIINEPTIHYIVKDCVLAGIKDIIIVTRFGNNAVEDFFDSTPALENYLVSKGKIKEAEMVKSIYSSANFIFVRQNTNLPYGNASPLYSVRELINDEAFIYAWGDDVILGDNCGAQELVDEWNKDKGVDVILNCTKVDESQISKIGIVKLKDEESMLVEAIIEKPKLEDAPSNIGSVSPYIFTKEIFKYLDPSEASDGKEFMIQNAIDELAKQNKVKAVITKGKWLTTGDPLNYLKATIEVALSRPDLRDEFIAYLKDRIG